MDGVSDPCRSCNGPLRSTIDSICLISIKLAVSGALHNIPIMVSKTYWHYVPFG